MNLQKTILFTLFSGLFAGTVFAQDLGSFEELDLNQDGAISADEASGTWSDELFAQLDTNQDGFVSKEEYGIPAE